MTGFFWRATYADCIPAAGAASGDGDIAGYPWEPLFLGTAFALSEPLE
jgi:hypothetical protein